MKSEKETIRLILVDDHPALLLGLKALLGREKDFKIVGEVTDGAEAVAFIKKTPADVIILDLSLPNKSGFEIMVDLKKHMQDAKIVVFTAYSDGKRVFSALQAGAIGYLLKDCTSDELVQAVRNASNGLPYLSSAIESNLLNFIQKRDLIDLMHEERLTDRENQILVMIAKGLSNTEIAEKISIAEGTVRTHISRILKKLHLKNRSQAVIYAMDEGLLPRAEDPR